MKTNPLLLLLPVLLLFSCGSRQLKNAKSSLEGSWTVVSATSKYGTRISTGTTIQLDTTETGNLGQFEFNEETVNYQYTRNDSSFQGNPAWELVREKENAGFTKVEVWYLTMGNEKFRVAFGDQTSDAEKNATEARFNLVNEGESEQFVEYSFSLEKN